MLKPNKYIVTGVQDSISSSAEARTCVFTFHGILDHNGLGDFYETTFVYKAAIPVAPHEGYLKNYYLYALNNTDIIVVTEDPTQHYERWVFVDEEGETHEKKVVVL